MQITSINERTTSYATAAFFDKNSDAALPTTLVYRIDCITTDTEIRADTTITPGETVEVTIADEENRIINQNNITELRVVTFTAGYGAGEQATEAYRYDVRNLHGITA